MCWCIGLREILCERELFSGKSIILGENHLREKYIWYSWGRILQRRKNDSREKMFFRKRIIEIEILWRVKDTVESLSLRENRWIILYSEWDILNSDEQQNRLKGKLTCNGKYLKLKKGLCKGKACGKILWYEIYSE